ncbi:MAG: glycosyltransferase family 2 protein [Chloroflexota bacterium]
MNLSVVVPVYRGEKLIEPLVERLSKVLPDFTEKYEIILVNDGSPDGSWTVIEQLAKKYKWVRGIRLMRNFGQQNATLCGIRAAHYEVIITMDQDLQHQPEDIPLLLAELEKGFDVVYGTPKKLPNSFIRNLLTSNIKQILANVMGVASLKDISAFCAFRAYLRAAFENFQSSSVIVDVLLSWGTTQFTSVTVNITEAYDSNYNFRSLVKVALLILMGFSTKPLRLASWIGFIMTMFGIGIFIYVLVTYFSVGSLPGFPFLASIIALFSGAQLFALGIFGEYLALMYNRSMDRPPYVIHQSVESE